VIGISAKFSQGGALKPAQGAYNTLWCATVQKAELKNGQYYEPVGVLGKKTQYAKDEEASRKLWEWTEEELRGDWTL
jgi:hypothetical protein